MERDVILACVDEVCPNPYYLCDSVCETCDQEWAVMLPITEAQLQDEPREELRICNCGRIHRKRLCKVCRDDEAAYEEADRQYEAKIDALRRRASVMGLMRRF